jgi:hypothetical protein
MRMTQPRSPAVIFIGQGIGVRIRNDLFSFAKVMEHYSSDYAPLTLLSPPIMGERIKVRGYTGMPIFVALFMQKSVI